MMPYMTLSGWNDDTIVSVLSSASDSRPLTVTSSFLLLAPRPLSPGGTRKYSPPVHLTIEPSSRDLDPTLSLLTQAGCTASTAGVPAGSTDSASAATLSRSAAIIGKKEERGCAARRSLSG